MKQKPQIVVTRRLPDTIETRMRELFNAALNIDDHAMTKDELIEAVKTAQVLVPTVTDEIDADVIAAAGEQLKLIANFGNGVDHIDVAAAQTKGIAVTNTPGVLTDDTADMTMALILAVSRRIAEGARVIPDGNFHGWSPTWMLGHRITGKRLGIVSVNCPHTPATYHLLSARRLKLLKRDAILVNTARGEIIDETALVKMLEAGEIMGAGLDVFEHEPAISPRMLKLAKQNRILVMPHMGSATIEGRIEMGEKVIINIRTFMDGHRPPDRVIASMV